MADPDVIVVGAGAAGMMAALAAADTCRVALVTDGPPGRSNTAMAQGGLQLPLPDPAARERFVADMAASARVAIDLERARTFAVRIPDTVAQLERWGLAFDRGPDGELTRRIAGGLSEPRIATVRDQIGPALVRVLRGQIARAGVEVIPFTRVVAIARRGDRVVATVRSARADAGADSGEIAATAIVCATGGVTYAEAMRRGDRTTNPRNDNHRLYRALAGSGLAQIHERYFQYQPFGVVDGFGDPVGSGTPGSDDDADARAGRAATGVCVPESIVGFPVALLDRHGREFGPIRQDRYALTHRMFEVARAGDAERAPDGSPAIRLTLSRVDPEQLAAVFPKIHRRLARAGRLGSDVLVYPFLHYQLGGFRVDDECRTAIPGLFLTGEMTGGLHGKNRLMGNGLTDSLVHGRAAGLAAARLAVSP